MRSETDSSSWGEVTFVGVTGDKSMILSQGRVWPLGHICQCLEIFLVATTEFGGVGSLACGGERPGVQLNILQCTGSPKSKGFPGPKANSAEAKKPRCGHTCRPKSGLGHKAA